MKRILPVFLMVVLSGCGFPHRGNIVDARAGQEIVDALNQYYADQTAWPRTLSELVPKYYKSQISTNWASGWTYTPDNAGVEGNVFMMKRSKGYKVAVIYRNYGPKKGWYASHEGVYERRIQLK